jgi:hypothetical protein
LAPLDVLPSPSMHHSPPPSTNSPAAPVSVSNINQVHKEVKLLLHGRFPFCCCCSLYQLTISQPHMSEPQVNKLKQIKKHCNRTTKRSRRSKHNKTETTEGRGAENPLESGGLAGRLADHRRAEWSGLKRPVMRYGLFLGGGPGERAAAGP